MRCWRLTVSASGLPLHAEEVNKLRCGKSAIRRIVSNGGSLCEKTAAGRAWTTRRGSIACPQRQATHETPAPRKDSFSKFTRRHSGRTRCRPDLRSAHVPDRPDGGMKSKNRKAPSCRGTRSCLFKSDTEISNPPLAGSAGFPLLHEHLPNPRRKLEKLRPKRHHRQPITARLLCKVLILLGRSPRPLV